MDSPIINSFLEADLRLVNPIVEWFCIEGNSVRYFTYSENNGGWTEVINSADTADTAKTANTKNTEGAVALSEGQPLTDHETKDIVHPGHANVHQDGLRMHPAPARCAPAADKTSEAFDDREWANFDHSEEVWAFLDDTEPLIPKDDESIALQADGCSAQLLNWIKGQLGKETKNE